MNDNSNDNVMYSPTVTFEKPKEVVGTQAEWVQPDGKTIKTNIRNIPPMDVIKHVAKLTGTLIKDPKPNCKHCHGLGYVGRYASTGEPIACQCIFVKMAKSNVDTSNIFMPRKLNRKERRNNNHKK